MLSSGSLLPSGRSNGMLVKLSLLDGAPCVTVGAAIVTINAKLTKTTIRERILYRSLVQLPRLYSILANISLAGLPHYSTAIPERRKLRGLESRNKDIT